MLKIIKSFRNIYLKIYYFVIEILNEFFLNPYYLFIKITVNGNTFYFLCFGFFQKHFF